MVSAMSEFVSKWPESLSNSGLFRQGPGLQASHNILLHEGRRREGFLIQRPRINRQ